LGNWHGYGTVLERAAILQQMAGDDPEACLPEDMVNGLPPPGLRADTLLTAAPTAFAAPLSSRYYQEPRGWCAPEILRMRGEALSRNARGEADAEAAFRIALSAAGGQGALSWRLRSATSLAELLLRQGKPLEAYACLTPVYELFTEGFQTADLLGAARLLDRCASPLATESQRRAH
jgi:hypothetical protein